MKDERDPVVELLLRVLAAYDDVPPAAHKAEATELAEVMNLVDTYLRAQGELSHLEAGLIRLPSSMRQLMVREARAALPPEIRPLRLSPEAARRIEKVSAPGSRVLRYVAARASEAQGDFEAHGGRR